jgi:hypothetical protein
MSILTRSQYSTPKNPEWPLIIQREGEDINSLIKVKDGEKDEFLAAMRFMEKLTTPRKQKLCERSTRPIDQQDDDITIPGVRLVVDPACHTRNTRTSSIIETSSKCLVADCTGCGKTCRFRPAKNNQHNVRQFFCGQYKQMCCGQFKSNIRVEVASVAVKSSAPSPPVCPTNLSISWSQSSDSASHDGTT